MTRTHLRVRAHVHGGCTDRSRSCGPCFSPGRASSRSNVRTDARRQDAKRRHLAQIISLEHPRLAHRGRDANASVNARIERALPRGHWWRAAAKAGPSTALVSGLLGAFLTGLAGRARARRLQRLELPLRRRDPCRNALLLGDGLGEQPLRLFDVGELLSRHTGHLGTTACIAPPATACWLGGAARASRLAAATIRHLERQLVPLRNALKLLL
mmetsp:Transcript_35841/g.94172  ORF Transcript_35841/g.94172 Transcript_35841/m.94172 type:complete len:213 (-) Transcript_35841:1283-1921(-)